MGCRTVAALQYLFPDAYACSGVRIIASYPLGGLATDKANRIRFLVSRNQAVSVAERSEARQEVRKSNARQDRRVMSLIYGHGQRSTSNGSIPSAMLAPPSR